MEQETIASGTPAEGAGSRAVYVKTPLLMPRYEDGTADVDTLGRLADHVRGGGISSFVLHGTTGEALGATYEERLQVIDRIGNLRRPGEQWIYGAGVDDLQDTVTFSKHAISRGADAVLIVTPDFWQKGNYRDPEMFGKYYKGVLESNHPVYMYQSPGKDSLTPGFVAGMAKRHPNLMGLKSGNLPMLLATREMMEAPDIERPFEFSCGDDRYILEAALQGMGATSGWSNCFPRAIRYIAEQARGDYQGAGVIQNALDMLILWAEEAGRGVDGLNPVSWQKAVFNSGYVAPGGLSLNMGKTICYGGVPESLMPEIGGEAGDFLETARIAMGNRRIKL